MAAFSSLTDRLSNAFKHLKSKGKLSEADIDGTIREIRRALLDADVALDVVRSFTGRIRERALGTEVSQALNPAQQVVKIVNEELTAVLGAGVDRPLNFAKNPPTVIMLAGLQGAGKTTLAGKLGYWLKDSRPHSAVGRGRFAASERSDAAAGGWRTCRRARVRSGKGRAVRRWRSRCFPRV